MKKLSIILAILAATLATPAQNSKDVDVNGLGDKVLGSSSAKTSQTATLAKPIDIEVGHNQWQAGSITDKVLAAIIAEMIEQSGGEIAGTTERLLREGFERDQLSNSKWVDTSSSRFEEKTLKPAQIRFEILNGGDSSSGSTRIGIGNDSVSLEHGTSTAFIKVAIRDLTTGKQLGTLSGKGSRSSTNFDGLSIASRFSWRGRGFPGINYDSWNNQNPEWRRGMIAVMAALDDLEKKIQEYLRTGEIPKENWRGQLEKK